MEKTRHCVICGKPEAAHYEGYHLDLCKECFHNTPHEELIRLRENYWKNQQVRA